MAPGRGRSRPAPRGSGSPYVDERAEILGEFTGRNIRTRPAEYGRSTAIEITDAPDLLELGRDFARRLGLCGVAKLDFKRDAAGERWLLEVNPRFNLWHHPGARAGVKLPALAYRDLVGLPRTARAGVRWMFRYEDARAARGRHPAQALASLGPQV